MITLENCLSTITEKAGQLNEPVTNGCDGTGIVIVAGGEYLQYAYATVRQIRDLGCQLPIQIWHLGDSELPGNSRELFKPYGVKFWDAVKINAETGDLETLGGWQAKALAVKRCTFQHVLLLDADSVPTINPEELFSSPQYQESGAIFWPDIPNPPYPKAAQCFGIEEFNPIESGQLMVDKVRHWKAVQMVTWLNSNSEFFYRVVYGDKDLWWLGFRAVEIPYLRAPACTVRIYGLEHHWFDGRTAFTHLIHAKRHRLFAPPPPTDRYREEFNQLFRAIDPPA